MARPEVFYWPTADDEGFALTQDVTHGNEFILNGPLVNNGIGQFTGISRTVSITSSDDLSLNTFTVTGTLNGKTVSEAKFPGPNAETLNTTQVFDSVVSISTDLDATNASIGSGLLGYTHWAEYNYQASIVGFVIQVDVGGGIKYSFETTLNDVTNPTYVPTLGTNLFSPILTNITASRYTNYNNVTRYSRIEIVDNTFTDDTGTLTATFIQQGIT